MKLQFVLSVLPLLAVGQTTSAQNFATLCGSGQTTGTTTLGGEQFTYHCNKRASVSNVAGKTVNINDPKDCSARATGNTAAVGVSWRSNGECYISSAGPPVTQTGCIFFEKLANTGGGTPDPCCLERDNLQTQLQTCQAERSQFQSDLTSCQTGAATCQASLTSCQTGAATCQASLTSCQASNSGTGPGSGPGSGGRVSDCRGVARTEGMGTQQQAGHSWSVNCNSIAGQGIINRPADTVAGLPECVDKCAQTPSCKVALVMNQARNNCVMYTTFVNPRAGNGNHYAVRN